MDQELEYAGGTNDTSAVKFYLNLAATHELLSRREEYSLARTLARSKKGLVTFIARLPKCCQAEISSSHKGFLRLDVRSTSTAVFSDVCDAIAFHLRSSHSNRSKRIGMIIGCCYDRLRESFDSLVLFNLRLVVSMAKKAAFVYKIPLIDVIQDGNTGLMKGIDRFDHRRGSKLSTYASWWIRQAMSRANVNTSRMIRLPPQKRTLLSRLIRFVDGYRAKNGCLPPKKKMLAATGLKTTEALDNLFRYAEDVISLESSRAPGDERTIGELVADPGAKQEDFLERQMYHRAVVEILAMLSVREQRVLMLRNGLVDGREYTLKEIGDMPEFRFSRERTRQIEAKALRKARIRARKYRIQLPSRFDGHK